MGIRGLQTFIEQKLGLLTEIELHNCNVLFDGNSIYHQMYNECHLTCLFGGEYDKFYHYCKQLFESFRQCQINVLVVFDGARLDDRKLSTVLERSKKRVDYSTKASVNVDLSPLLLRQAFISVLDQLNIPYISALGEGDDESVSLANHLDCYLIARDSDYYCYDLYQGYVPFDYVDINPIQKESYYYLSARLFTVESLFDRFVGLNSSTLALACCLCGNDYIKGDLVAPIFDHIMATVEKTEKNKSKKNVRTSHWYAMQWIRHFNDVDDALAHLLEVIKARPENKKIETNLRSAIQMYINPSDTLIYRFALSTNQNLRKSAHFLQLAQQDLLIVDRTEEQIRSQINEDLSKILSKRQHPLPTVLLDAMTDLQAMESFVETLIHRRLICSAHVELEREPSIHVDGIAIILPCLAILLKWDGEEEEQSVFIYHRVLKQLKQCDYSLNEFDDLIDLHQIPSLSLIEREQWVFRCLKIPFAQREQYDHIHPDYHLWLMILRYWSSTRQLSSVYLYAIIICLIKTVHLVVDEEFLTEELEPLSLPVDDPRNSQHVLPKLRRVMNAKFKAMSKRVYDAKKFDCSIIHEFNCLQTIYMYTMKLNDFFQRPFHHRIEPQYFLCGSFLYAFVDHYETKRNLSEALSDLFQQDATLLAVMNKLYAAV